MQKYVLSRLPGLPLFVHLYLRSSKRQALEEDEADDAPEVADVTPAQ